MSTLADRIHTTTTTTGTGTVTVSTAALRKLPLSTLADATVVPYTIEGQGASTEWEMGYGTVGGSGTTLTRTTVVSSSNSNNAVSFSAGTKDVFVTLPAAMVFTHSLTSKGTPIDADEVSLWDSVTATIQRLTWANMKATLGAVFAALAGSATQAFAMLTAAQGTNTTQGATTAFVVAEGKSRTQYVATLIQQLGSETYVLSLASLGGGVVLAGTYPTGQIYKSTDSGATWTLIQQLGSETQVRSLASLGGGVVLAGTYPTGQIYKSTDSGATWTLIQQLGSETYVYSLASLGGGVVLAGTGSTGQIYKSTDSGATWTLIQQLGSETQVYSLASLGGGVVLAGTDPTGQIYKSTDSGATWTLIQQLGSETYVSSLASLGGGVVLAGTYPTGQIYRTAQVTAW